MDQGDGWTRVRRIQSGPRKTHLHLFIANIKEEDTKLKQLINFVYGTISLKMILDTVNFPAPISLLFLQS